MVTAGYENTGVAEFIGNHKQEIFPEDTITIDMFANTFFRNYSYSADDNILVLFNKKSMSSKVKIFIVSSINKKLSKKFSYGGQYRMGSFDKTKIQLPTKNKKIDFEFMESFITQLEAEKISKLENYLKASGLKDYSLTDEEQKVLDNFENGKFDLKEFKIEDLFNIKGNPQLNKESFTFNENGEYPYFTRTVSNNGILGYVDYLNDKHKIKGNCLAVGMMGMQFFYMQKDFYAGQFTKRAIPKSFSLNQKIATYFIILLNKHQNYFKNILVRNFENEFYKTNIQLPTINNQPDYKTMETFISAIQKLVIKDVVLYTDKKLGKFR